MKAGIVFTGTGPILILTTYNSFADVELIEKLNLKGRPLLLCHFSGLS